MEVVKRHEEDSHSESDAACSHWQYAALFADHPQPMWVFDRATRAFLAVNDAALRHYGYSRDEFLRLTLDDIRPQEAHAALDEHFARGQNPTVSPTTWTHVRKGGERIDVEVRAHDIEWNRKAAVLVQIVDVTHRRRAEERLVESNDALESVFQGSPDAIVALDRDGNVTMWNRAAEKLFGWLASEVVGHPLPILPETEREQARARHSAAIHGWLFNEHEVRRVRKDGQAVDVDIARAPLLDARGAIRGVVLILQDCSERRHLEEQLRQSQKMEAVGQLAGGVAHDFNNLLTVITGYSNMVLRRGDMGDRSRAQIDEIRRAAERASALTRQLLAFSRRQVLQPRVLNLDDVVGQMKTMLGRLIGEHVEVEFTTDRDLAPVTADPGQLEQVIMNLAVNARDAMPNGGKLTIRTSNLTIDASTSVGRGEATPGHYVLLAVSDTGCGMDEATRGRIFEPFFTTKETGKGTGLGLATVYGIVKQSGGTIWVTSAPGQGTTVSILLPTIQGVAPEPERDVRSIDPLVGHETVLLVEDQLPVRRMIRSTLEEGGYTVLEASNGEDALVVSGQYTGTIDLLVTDVVMPKMGGPELAERITRVRPAMRMLFISGYADPGMPENGVLAGGVDFLGKPFTPQDLTRKLREVLGGARRAR